MKMLSAQNWARLGIVILLYLSGFAPVHLAEEVHALLPASQEHHADLHDLDKHADVPGFCHELQDDVSKPLSSTEHERHHEADCAEDGIFNLLRSTETVQAAPFQWHVTLIEYVPVTPIRLVELPTGDLHSRPPPERAFVLPSLSYPLQSGRAPPAQA